MKSAFLQWILQQSFKGGFVFVTFFTHDEFASLTPAIYDWFVLQGHILELKIITEGILGFSRYHFISQETLSTDRGKNLWNIDRRIEFNLQMQK